MQDRSFVDHITCGWLARILAFFFQGAENIGFNLAVMHQRSTQALSALEHLCIRPKSDLCSVRQFRAATHLLASSSEVSTHSFRGRTAWCPRSKNLGKNSTAGWKHVGNNHCSNGHHQKTKVLQLKASRLIRALWHTVRTQNHLVQKNYPRCFNTCTARLRTGHSCITLEWQRAANDHKAFWLRLW